MRFPSCAFIAFIPRADALRICPRLIDCPLEERTIKTTKFKTYSPCEGIRFTLILFFIHNNEEDNIHCDYKAAKYHTLVAYGVKHSEV